MIKGKKTGEDEMYDSSSGSQTDSTDDDYAWIHWFCALKGNEFFCEVDITYIQDGFNLTRLNERVPYYDYALDLILDIEPQERLSDDQQELIENDAENLFGLIHARYILTNAGLHKMLEKYRLDHFGRCPRMLCGNQPCLPIGTSDTINNDSVKLYCPKCEEIYAPKSSRHQHIDGAYFGTTFPHLFYLSFPELKPDKTEMIYIPRVFCFRVNKYAYAKSLAARKQNAIHNVKKSKAKRLI